MSVRRLLLCGEAERGDDAAAHVAGARLAPEAVAGVEVRWLGGIDVDDLLGLDGGACVVADTVAGPPPGTLWVRDLTEVAAGGAGGRHSTHTLPLPEVIALAGAMGSTPVTGTFVGIAGERFGLGAPLSAPVAAAMDQFVSAIEAALHPPIGGDG